jgi:membrane protein YdbS with pleckstrin-like domain
MLEEGAQASKSPSHFKHDPMMYILISFAVLALTFAIGMLWTKGKDDNDSSLKTIAVVAAVAFIVLALILPGGSTGQ